MVSWAGTGGPELRGTLRNETRTWPDQDSKYRARAVSTGRGEGDYDGSVLGGSREELASKLSIKNEEKWQRWGKENSRSKNRKVEKSA